MANNARQILIESILGGESQYQNFSAVDEFQQSMGIDPSLAFGDLAASGYINPTVVRNVGNTVNNWPVWFVTNPKNSNYYLYDTSGSLYSVDTNVTGLTDLNDGGTARGNGLAYYDNYLYASRSTTIARYGPLDGTPAWTDDYWVGSLGKAALVDTAYPSIPQGLSITSLNHVLHRHTDGKLYIADVVGNQGTLHYISTSKTTVEGDTDNGSTYNALDFPYGYWPTAMASYGDQLVVALYEGNNRRAKLAFWDTTNSTTYEKIIDSEYPDTIISALINSNGLLYAFSGSPASGGVRILRFLGGYSFEQVGFVEGASLPLPGAVLGRLNQVDIGTRSTRNTGTAEGCVISIGTKLEPVSNKVFTTFGPAGSHITTLLDAPVTGQRYVAYYNSSGVTSRVARQEFPTEIATSATASNWVSQIYRIGNKFKITKITILLNKGIESNDTFAIVPIIRLDQNTSTKTLQTINYTNYPLQNRIVLRPESCVGNLNFNLELDFSGISASGTYGLNVALPISIEYEIIDD